jgi:hypothetical protein
MPVQELTASNAKESATGIAKLSSTPDQLSRPVALSAANKTRFQKQNIKPKRCDKPEKSSVKPPIKDAVTQPFTTVKEKASDLKRMTWAESRTTELTITKPTNPARVLLPLNFFFPKMIPNADAAGSAKPDK